MDTENPKTAIEYIHSLGRFSGKPGLHRIKALCEALGNPQDRLKFVHLAGTNGKGSTACMIASALQAAGLRTGLYTSPYLVQFYERIRVDGVMISDVDLLQTGELDQVGRGRAGNPGNALADRFPALSGDNEHLTAVAQILGDPAVFICYANVHNRPSTVLSAPESSSGSFASSILPASTAAASFGSIGSLARTGSS